MLKNDALGYSNVVQFSNPNTAKSNEYQGVGFHIDKLGGTQLEPIIIAKNVGTTDSNIQIKIPYTRSDGTTNTIILPTEKLKAGEMSQINANQITNIGLQENIKVAGIEVTYDTPNGSVIVAAHSVSPNRNQVYRVPMWDPLQQKSPTGGYPWRIEPTSTTKAYIKNITDQEEDYVAFLLWENGGEYMIGLKAIKPHQSIEIDVKKLRDDQTPDERGRIIPLNISNGQLQWVLRRKDTLPEDDLRGTFALIGRSEQIDFVKNTSSSYACQNCCGLLIADGYIYPNNNVQITQGNTRQFEVYESNLTCYGLSYSNQIFPDSWSSSNTNTATIGQTGIATGINAGTTNIKANWRSTRTRDGIPCPTGSQLVIGCNEGIDQTFENALAEKGKEDDEPVPTRLPCGNCISSFVNMSANTDITVVEPDFTITVPPSADDGSTVTFSSTITKGTPVSYQWSFTSPTGAGNNPQVNFASASSSTTTAQAHWFALPNQPCSTGTPSNTDPYYNSQYTITAKVAFQGGREVTKSANFSVNAYWNPAGKVPSATNSGTPAIGQDSSTGLWKVTGIGTLNTVLPSATIYIPNTSQFYSKTVQHEHKHELQWQSGIFSDLLTVKSIMNEVTNLTDQTQSGLVQKVNQAINNWFMQQELIYISRINASEIEAYTVSDPLLPMYAYQRCGRTQF
jgi:hypothetical protein